MTNIKKLISSVSEEEKGPIFLVPDRSGSGIEFLKNGKTIFHFSIPSGLPEGEILEQLKDYVLKKAV